MEQYQTFQVLKTRIETNLLHNEPTKYDQLKACGLLDEWLRSQAQQAWDAMNSTTNQANLSQRAAPTADHLNPESSEPEEESETEESPEDAWLGSREQKVIIDPTSSGE